MVEMRSGTLIRVTIGVLLILILTQGVHAATTTNAYSFVKEWNGPGSPWGIAVDGNDGWVYAADQYSGTYPEI